MTKILTNIKEATLELWNDDQGAEGLEKVLIIAAIALPLLAVLLFFSGEIREWVSDNWDSVQGNSDTNNDAGDNPFN
jgi:Flp pilus assembly pilin Flp